jgi:anti-sigma regulatory factor (Ser/Thr protein kinase)
MAVLGSGQSSGMGARLMLTTELSRTPEAGREARAAVAALADQLGPARTEDARLLLTELAANAVKHGQGSIFLSVEIDDGRALFWVYDDGHAEPHVRAHAGADGGWGLRIVDRLADRWGVARPGTVVWFELAAS